MIKTKFKQTEIGLIPEGWEVKELGEISDFQYGLGESAQEKGDYIYIRITDINQNGFLNKSNLTYIDKNKVKENNILQKGDVLVARTGASFGKTYLFNENFKATFGGFLIKFLFNNKLINNKFFFQFSRSNNYWNQANNLVGGGAQPQFNANVLSKLKIPLPNLEEQQKIANILSDLDSKIELNQQMNKTLEAIGQTLFKHWFVDFEFPNEQGKPYKSLGGEMIYNEELEKEIPKDWKIGFLGDKILSEISKPGINKFSDEKIYLDTSCVNNTIINDLSYKITFENRPSRANMKPEPNTVWFAKMKDSRKVLLIDNYSKFILNNIILSTGFSCLKTKPESLYYLWNFILSDTFDNLKNNLATGTTMQGINNNNIKKIKILIPTNEILLKFNDLVKPIYEKIYKNDLEIQSLSQIRDSLLPKLMSGRIRVI